MNPDTISPSLPLATDTQDEYQSQEEIDFEKEADFQEKVIIEDAEFMEKDLLLTGLIDYLLYNLENGEEPEFFEDWKSIFCNNAKVWDKRHEPLTRQLDKAIRFKAEQMAVEALK